MNLFQRGKNNFKRKKRKKETERDKTKTFRRQSFKCKAVMCEEHAQMECPEGDRLLKC